MSGNGLATIGFRTAMLIGLLVGGLAAQAPQEQDAGPPATQPALPPDAGQIEGPVDYSALGDTSIVLQGDEKDLAILQAIIQALDQAVRPELKIFTLTNARAIDVAPTLTSTYRELARGARTQRPEDRVSFVADAKSNSVIVAASREKMAEVAELIAKLDQVPLLPTVNMQVFTLKNIRATEASSLLDGMIQKLQASKGIRGDSQITIVPDERTNSLFITAAASDLKQIEGLLKILDVPPAFATAEMILVPLTYAEAQPLAQTLNEMLAAGQAGGRGGRGAAAMAEQIRRLRLRTKQGQELPELDLEKPIRIIAEPGTNALLISSHPDNNKAMAEITRLLDGLPVGEEVKFRLYPLEYADATALATLLEEIFTRGKAVPGVPGKPRRAAVAESVIGEALSRNVGLVADVRTNVLVASGTEPSLALIETLVGQMDKPDKPMLPVEFVALEHADATRVAQTVQQLMDYRYARMPAPGASLKYLKPMVVPDLRSNSVLVIAHKSQVAEIKDLLGKLDTLPEALLDQVRIITLDKTQANVIAPKIEQLWQRRAQLRRTGGIPEDRPVITTDERSNALLIASNVEDFEMIQKLVAALEAQPLAPIAEIRIITLSNNDAGAVGPTIQRLFDQRLQMRQTPGAQPLPSDRVAIAVDTANNALLVASSKENYDHMVALVSKLDQEISVEGVVRLYQLTNADARRVGAVIDQMFQEGLYKPGAVGPGSTVAQAREKVTIATDERTNVLIVSASKENFTIIESLIMRMDDDEAPFLHGNIQMFELKFADALKLSDMLQRLFDELRQSRQAVGGQNLELPVNVIPDERSNTLIVVGSRDGITRARDLIAQLDVKQTRPTAEFRVYPLAAAAAAKLAPMMQDLFNKQQAASPEKTRTPIQIKADDGSNALIVSASGDDHTMVEGLIALLDKPPGTAQQVEIIPLRTSGRAARLAELLNEIYVQRARASQLPGPTVTVSADERSNSLVVSAAPGDMADLRKMIEDLDAAGPIDEATIRIFRLLQADAEDLAETLNQLMSGQGGRVGGGRAAPGGGGTDSLLISFVAYDEGGQPVVRKIVRQNVQILPEPRTNSLVVVAERESMAMLESLIGELDNISPVLAEIKVFTLRNADATEMVKTLESLFQVGAEAPRGDQEEQRQLMFGPAPPVVQAAAAAGAAGPSALTGGAREMLSFTVDTRTNSVIAAGSKGYLEIVARIIEDLDTQQVEPRLSRVVSLKHRRAEDVEQALKASLAEDAKLYEQLGDEAAQRRIEREVTIASHPEANQVILTMSPRYENRVLELVRQLDMPPPQVMIQVLLAEVTLDDSLEMGIEWGVQDLLFTEKSGGTGFGPGKDIVVGTDLGAAGTGALGGFSFTITGEDFSFLLRALQSEGRLEVLSRPQIMASDNQDARISVGQEVPFVRNVIYDNNGRPQVTVEYEDVGIILEVTPQINPDGYVKLDVKPEISAITNSNVVIVEGVNAPIFRKREAETSVTVKDGETVVIGGLITSTEDLRENKIPVLGDIPVVGWLGRASIRDKEKTELLIVLTPKVVRTVEEARALSIEERDKTGMLGNIRESPLMGKLQVKPEDNGLGPVEGDPVTPPPGVEPEDLRIYGPARPTYGPERSEAAPAPERPVVETRRKSVAVSDAEPAEPGRDDYMKQRR